MTQFAKLPVVDNAQKSPRRVGYELEFAQIELKTVAQILSETLKGEIERKSEAEWLVDSELGPFVVELDWSTGKAAARERAKQIEDEDDPLAEWLTKLAGQLVPVEIVCPPIPVDKIELLDPVIERLRDEGAVGTEQSVVYAFGLHINVELPDEQASTIARYIQAYALCQDWLVQRHNVDLVRRVTPYINLYPQEYVEQVLKYDESISMEQLIDDYLEHNPTRNRALDMLPIFKHFDEDKIVSTLDDARINARPAFHYRMPNCEIEQPGWGLAQAWNIWCVIETLTCEPDILADIAAQWSEHADSMIPFQDQAWHATLDQILDQINKSGKFSSL